MVRHAVWGLLLAVLASPPVFAQQWAAKMFETTSHDFGSIARGAKAEYEFVLKNIYVEDVHIASVHVSCGCTTPRIKKSLLKTYEKGAIVASINSQKFLGRQGATITVTIDRPAYARVRLHVRVHVRSDVVLEPAAVELGNVDQGTPAEKTLSVTSTRRSDWKILDVKSANPHLSGEVTQQAREGSRVCYELCVRLDADAPAGYLSDHLVLVTNDRRSPQIPVMVEGRVLPEITVSPASLFLGVVPPGRKVTKQVVVRAKRPFRITAVTSDADCFELSVPAEAPAKPLHVIPITFVAGDQHGKIVKTIRIETDLDGAAAELSTYAVVTSEE